MYAPLWMAGWWMTWVVGMVEWAEIYSMFEGIFLGLLMASNDPCQDAIFYLDENHENISHIMWNFVLYAHKQILAVQRFRGETKKPKELRESFRKLFRQVA